MTSLFLNWVLTASLLTAVVIVLRAAFGKHISARLRYALWAVVLLRLLVPVQLFTAPVETSQVIPAVRTIQALPNITPERRERPVQNAAADPAVQTVPMPDSEASAPSATEARKTPDPSALLGGAWMTGTALAALALLWSNLSFARRLRRVRVPLAARASLATRASLAGTDCPFRVYIAEGLPSPCLFGLIRPAAYLTPKAAADPTMLRHVLAHETTHFRHGDHIWSVLRCAALAIHWWNPLVWLAAVLSRRDAELACDEGALKRLGDGERSAYGGTLLALVTAKPQPVDLLRCATTMTGAKRSLRERIGRIAHAPKRWLWAAVLAVVLSALVCACSFVRTEKKPEDRPLTQKELDYFNSEVFNGDGFNIRNQFLLLAVKEQQYYKQIDLFKLFYNGTGKPVGVSEEERRAVVNAAWGGEDPGVDLIKCPAKEMDEVLREHLGLSLEDMDKLSLDGFTYFSEYDAYYSFHGDTNYIGNVAFTYGEYKDGNILLYYPTQVDIAEYGAGWLFFNGQFADAAPMEENYDGYACVTLEERENGGYHFLSNWKCDPPVIPTAYPNWGPELVIPLDGLEPYEPERMTLEYHTGDVAELLRGVAHFDPDGDDSFDVQIYRSTDGNIYAALVLSETERHCFMEIGYDASPEQISLKWYDNICGYSGFRITCPMLMGTYLTAYYYIGEDGFLYQMVNDSGSFSEIDLDGDGQKELLWSPLGYNERILNLLYRRDGRLCKAEVKSLIYTAWPELGYIELSFWNTDIRYLPLTAQIPIPGTTVTAFRTLWFDGESLRMYRDETPYEDHVKAGIEAPSDVLAAARKLVEKRFGTLAEEGADGSVAWDDWRVTNLTGPYYETVDGLQVEIWNLGYETHTATPERVMLAGGSYRGEDGWCMIGYPDCDYLYFQLDENVDRTFLYARMENDCGPGDEMFREDLIRDLEAGGFLTPQPVSTLLDDPEAVSAALAFARQYETDRRANDPNVSSFEILDMSADREETLRCIKNYQNSELFEGGPWERADLGQSLLAVYEKYGIDFVDPKYMAEGTVGTFLYLLKDENGEWELWDYLTPWEITDAGVESDE